MNSISCLVMAKNYIQFSHLILSLVDAMCKFLCSPKLCKNYSYNLKLFANYNKSYATIILLKHNQKL